MRYGWRSGRRPPDGDRQPARLASGPHKSAAVYNRYSIRPALVREECLIHDNGMVARGKRPELPDTDEGHEQRLRLADERARRVLEASLASRPDVVSMGMRVNMLIDKRDGSVDSVSFPTMDWEALGYLAMESRPFTLAREEVQFEKVARSLRRFATTEPQQVMSAQLDRLREQSGHPRMYFYMARRTDGQELIPGGTTDAKVGDRVLYSQLVHADDESDLLQHIDTDTQGWALAGMVGDWVALIAHYQWITHMIRPDLCPHLSSWAGTPRTIFERLGVTVEETEE